jgi:hypothetical protein
LLAARLKNPHCIYGYTCGFFNLRAGALHPNLKFFFRGHLKTIFRGEIPEFRAKNVKSEEAYLLK